MDASRVAREVAADTTARLRSGMDRQYALDQEAKLATEHLVKQAKEKALEAQQQAAEQAQEQRGGDRFLVGDDDEPGSGAAPVRRVPDAGAAHRFDFTPESDGADKPAPQPPSGPPARRWPADDDDPPDTWLT